MPKTQNNGVPRIITKSQQSKKTLHFKHCIIKQTSFALLPVPCTR